MHLLYVCAVIAVGRPILESETIVDVLASFDISAESHYATTEDGYILNMHRLAGHDGQPVIFFQHGILASSIAWLVNDEASPPVYFWKRGYDVWLGNNRGNTYSRNHTSLDPQKDNDFWDFGFSTLGECDVPAQLNYVLEKTAKANLTYVGWSQGSTQMFVNQIGNPPRGKCSHDKVSGINLFVALSPVVYMEHSKDRVLRWMGRFGILAIMEKLFSHGILLSRSVLRKLVAWVCKHVNALICNKVKNYVFHSSGGPMNNATAVANLLAFTPAGTSMRSIDHYAQLMRYKYFSDYYYGPFQDWIKYRQWTLPTYNVGLSSSIVVPTALFFGEKDPHIQKLDRDRLLREVESNPHVVFHRVYKDFGHDTWVLATKEAQVYLEDMARLVKRYNGEGLENNGESLEENDDGLENNGERLANDIKSLDNDEKSLEHDDNSLDDDTLFLILSVLKKYDDSSESLRHL